MFNFTAYPRFLEEKVKELDLPKWNWHGLRRRRASIWANEDKPLFQIMMLLGHSNISTTQRYLFNLGIVKMLNFSHSLAKFTKKQKGVTAQKAITPYFITGAEGEISKMSLNISKLLIRCCL